MQWNPQSNVSDVLGLGPRTAGPLATVGIRTVGELLAAAPVEIAARLQKTPLTAENFAAWQGEARLALALPQLPVAAARLLAAAGIGSAGQLRQFTPTELVAALESAQKKNLGSWLASTAIPRVEEVGQWISTAHQSKKNFAA